MRSLSNLIDIWWHCLKGTIRLEPHRMCYLRIYGETHHYCDCGYKKPERIRVRTK